jgi:cardiolipin synthase
LVNSLENILQIKKSDSKMDMQLTMAEPNYEEKNLVNLFIMLFSKAKHSIKIVTPYFLPTDGIVSTLTTAS